MSKEVLKCEEIITVHLWEYEKAVIQRIFLYCEYYIHVYYTTLSYLWDLICVVMCIQRYKCIVHYIGRKDWFF